ncbi:uncharacterized protein LOC128250969 [Octopus bimaculoides]|uniref:uncharacterized protein LOC128250969 n=1 Tax=Octopus bimaculoides TaxID=37653 RepID=UPI0022E64289|nr:uncharacterized protein LOC128250969 [Octopus bimaculoides]
MDGMKLPTPLLLYLFCFLHYISCEHPSFDEHFCKTSRVQEKYKNATCNQKTFYKMILQSYMPVLNHTNSNEHNLPFLNNPHKMCLYKNWEERQNAISKLET